MSNQEMVVLVVGILVAGILLLFLIAASIMRKTDLPPPNKGEKDDVRR